MSYFTVGIKTKTQSGFIDVSTSEVSEKKVNRSKYLDWGEGPSLEQATWGEALEICGAHARGRCGKRAGGGWQAR